LAFLLGVVVAVVVGASAAVAAGSALRVQVDKSRVDLKGHRLEVKVSRPVGKLTVTVMGESGATLADEELDFTGRPASTPLVVTWTPSSDEPVARIEVRAYQSPDVWVGVELFPWFVPIPHDDVTFKTDSADIDASESPKLDSAFAKLSEALAKDRQNGREHAGITLFIVGHTDTVGGDGYNLKLSQARARAIGAWFRKRGVRLPIAYEGFGETSPKVQTADNVDEARNRRVDYILSDDPPVFKTAGFRPAWKRIP
jgi:outer membrane protein OmpA-like peptidoglycan-associated protein